MIDELVLRSGKPIMTGILARLPTLPECERLARANAAVRAERGEMPLASLLRALTDGLEDESQAVRATALGELRRAARGPGGGVRAALERRVADGVRVDPPGLRARGRDVRRPR